MKNTKSLFLILLSIYVALSVLSWLSYFSHKNEVLLEGRTKFYLEKPSWVSIKGKYKSDEEKDTFLVLHMIDAQGVEVILNGKVVFKLGGDGVASKIWRATFPVAVHIKKGVNEFIFNLWGEYGVSMPARPFLSDDPWLFSLFMNTIHTVIPMALSPVFIAIGIFFLYAITVLPKNEANNRDRRAFFYFSLSQISAGAFLLYYFTFPNFSSINFYYGIINKTAALSTILMLVFFYATFESMNGNFTISRYAVPIGILSVALLAFFDYRHSIKIITLLLPFFTISMAATLIFFSTGCGCTLLILSMALLVASVIQYLISTSIGAPVILPIITSVAITAFVMINMKLGDYLEYMRLANLSKIDPLTGIYNRKVLEEIKLKEGDSIAFIDINKFKMLNDIYGHDYGDRILRILSQVILENIKGKDHAIRYGGDEFLIIFRDCNKNCAEEIMKKISEDFKVRSKTTISYGISEYKGNLEKSIKEADIRMYKMKKKLGSGLEEVL